MKKIILIIEDKTTEQELAKTALLAQDCVPIIAGNLQDGTRLFHQLKDKLFGVITDLHYSSMVGNTQDVEKPNGLAMVALCAENNIRVAVCSDVNHHFSEYLRVPVRVLETHQNYQFKKIPFSEDQKKWNESLNKLLNL
jgi:DNA-binding NtrC family response regulator